MSQLNMELLEQLAVTCEWLRNSGVKLPNQSSFDSLLNKTMALLDEIQADEPKILQYKKLSDEFSHKKISDGNFTEPKSGFWCFLGSLKEAVCIG